MLKRLILIAGIGIALAGCQEGVKFAGNARARAPIPPATVALMREKSMSQSSPILIRVFKKESELELWKKGEDGRFALLKTYPICRWSGQLGPKKQEGDRQAPEGFYTITPALMNPNSSYYLSFDLGYPNAFDRANGRTGRHLMVHGACSSAGCYSMTDEQIAEIYAIGREAFNGGQRKFQVQAYPFRMTPQNMAKYRLDPNIDFWRNLKEGWDHFEATKLEPQVAVCNKRYVFNVRNSSALNPTGTCPALDIDKNIQLAVATKQQADEAKISKLLSKGTPAVRLIYQDGSQHPVFRGGRHPEGGILSFSRRTPGFDPELVSRPEALSSGPKEIVLSNERSLTAQTDSAIQAQTPAAESSLPLQQIVKDTASIAENNGGLTPSLNRMMSFSENEMPPTSNMPIPATSSSTMVNTVGPSSPIAPVLPPIRPIDSNLYGSR